MNRTDRKIARVFIPDFINQLRLKEIVTDEDIKSKAALEKLKTHLDENLGKTQFEVIVDHRETLLILADDAFQRNHFELSISMYATFIEHTLNRFIHLASNIKNVDSKTKVEIIRSVNLIGKCTWLLKLLGLPPIKIEYIKTISAIADERNAYIHYKWKSESDKKDHKDEKTMYLETQIKIKKLVKYLKNYESKVQYGGRKGKIQLAASH